MSEIDDSIGFEAKMRVLKRLAVCINDLHAAGFRFADIFMEEILVSISNSSEIFMNNSSVSPLSFPSLFGFNTRTGAKEFQRRGEWIQQLV